MGDVVQWDILFYKEHLISHLCDEATRWTTALPLPNRTATAIIQAMSADWLEMHGPMRLLVADQESALQSGCHRPLDFDVLSVWIPPPSRATYTSGFHRPSCVDHTPP